MQPDLEWEAAMLDQEARHLVANLLRVVRGTGKVYNVVTQMQLFLDRAHRCTTLLGVSRTDGIIASALNRWDDTQEYRLDCLDANDGSYQRYSDDGHFERLEATDQITKGALQFVASKLIGQRPQMCAGESEMARGINAILEMRRAEDVVRRRQQLLAPARHSPQPTQPVAGQPDPYLYFISDGAAIKIGVSGDPKKRLRGLQTAHHSPLTLLGTMSGGYELEAELHARFDNDRLNGEWFTPTAELRSYIAANATPHAANDNEKDENTLSVQSVSKPC